MKAANAAIYTASFLCIPLSLLLKDCIWTALGAVPFLLLLCTLVHELGHIMGCALTGGTVTAVMLPLLSFDANGLCLHNRIRPVSYCTFRNSRRKWLVYLMGPLFSLMLWCLFLYVSILFRTPTYLVSAILAFGVLAVNIIPYRNNDAAMFLREVFRRKEIHT